MEEQRAAQPLPAGGGSERLRQRLCDDHHEQPRHVIAAPTVDWDAWYLNSNPGPYYGCLTTSGTPPTFDNDQGSATAPNVAKRNNSVTTLQDLTPSTSYTCKGSAGELSWNATTKVLTANGTIFIDGSAQIQNGSVNTYTGSATIYVSGTLLIKNSKHVPGGQRGHLHDERLESGAEDARVRGQRQRVRRSAPEPGLDW